MGTDRGKSPEAASESAPWRRGLGDRRALLRRAGGAAAVGFSFGLAEFARLKSGGLTLPLGRGLSVLAAYIALALTAFVAAHIACRLAAGPARRAHPWLGELVDAAPMAAAPLLFAGTFVNVRWLPSATHPGSLLVDLLMVAAALSLGLWLHRARGRRPLQSAVITLWVVACLIVATWAFAPAASSTTRSAQQPGARPDIYLILIDTLRADHLGSDGYAQATSPFLDSVAAESVVFENAYSSSNWTRPAVASLMTSTMPSRHGAVVHHRAPSRQLPLLAEALQAAGYATGFFVAGGNVEASDGYDRGVEHFFSAHRRDVLDLTVVGKIWLYPLFRRLRAAGTPEYGRGQIPPQLLVDEALRWTSRQAANRPVFAYIHFQGPHSPYSPPEDLARSFGSGAEEHLAEPPEHWAGLDALSAADRRQMVAQYDAEIRWHDAAIESLHAGLSASRRFDGSVAVVTSDHGEAFGEHGSWAHNDSLFEEITRVPLLVRLPAGTNARRDDTNVSLLDVAPTLLDLAGATLPPSFDGSSLRGLLNGEPGRPRTVFFENPVNGELGVRTPDWVYFEGPRPGADLDRWLFAGDDRGQRTNLAGERPEVADRLAALVRARQTADRDRAVNAEDIVLDDARVEELRDLGYLQ